MADQTPILVFNVDGAVAYLKLNRPHKRNALNDELIAELKAALRRADGDENIHCIVILGGLGGGDFSSGADLAALQKISGASVAENLEDARGLMELFTLIRNIHVPVIAAVSGRALAGGCGLALACDIVLADESARFGFPEVNIGFVPAMVMAILRRNVSEKIAFELLTCGEEIPASRAEQLGLVNHVFSTSMFEGKFREFAARFENRSRSAVALTKRLFYRTDAMDFEAALFAGMDINTTARMTQDCQKGIAKFLKQ